MSRELAIEDYGTALVFRFKVDLSADVATDIIMQLRKEIGKKKAQRKFVLDFEKVTRIGDAMLVELLALRTELRGCGKQLICCTARDEILPVLQSAFTVVPLLSDALV